MTGKQAKKAYLKGFKVFWHHEGYEVIHDSLGQWLLHCNLNGTYWPVADTEKNYYKKGKRT